MKSIFYKSIIIVLAFLLIAPMNLVVGLSTVHAQGTVTITENLEEKAILEKAAREKGVRVDQLRFGSDSDPNFMQNRGATGAPTQNFNSINQAGIVTGAIPLGNTSATQPNLGTAGSGLLSCSVGSILANAIQGAISNVVGSLVGSILGQEVPTINRPERSATVGKTIFGIPVLPSWDAIAYCLVNTTIAYIAQSTVNWANNGFQGSPAFVTDPGRFFQSIADIETQRFIQGLTGVGICQPFQQSLQRNIATNYLSTYPQQAKCTYNQTGVNPQANVLSGKGPTAYGDLLALTQLQNTPFGSQILADAQINSIISIQQGIQKFNLQNGNGFLSSLDKNGQISVPGSIIFQQLGQRLGVPLDRVTQATKFDQVITELINVLIKVSLNEVLKGVRL